MRRFLRDRRGASNYIEAIITFPIVILLVIGVINGGMVVFGQAAVQDAARHGARMGSVTQQGGAAMALKSAQEAVARVGFLRNAKVSILAPGGMAGSIMKIQVTAEIPNFFGRLIPFLNPSFQVKADSTFRQEGW